MKTKETIIRNIEKNKELSNKINDKSYSDVNDFINNAKRYIKAIKQGRMLCVIEKVSQSGMSRNLKFHECNGNVKNGFNYYNFYLLFKMLGFTPVKNSDSFRINGCGMDMVFHTNYTIIHDLYTLGFLTKKECDVLSQKTPTTL